MRGFRVAAPRSAAGHVAWTLLYSACFWTLFLYVFPQAIRAAEAGLGLPAPAPRPGLGIALFAACGTLGLTSGITMALAGRGTPLPLDTAREMVLCGPYRHLRNPMALAGIGQGVAVGIWIGSFGTVAYSLLGAVVWHTIARPPEERDLAARFGDRYCAYRAAVPLWWPRRHPYRDVDA